jgi:putative salt-induced outer membrane protein
MNKITVSILCLLLTLSGAYANSKTGNPVWSGSAQAGFSSTGGNSNDNNLTAKLVFNQKTIRWSNSYTLNALNSNSNGAETAERYANTFQWKYLFSKKLFFFASNNSFYDKYNPYDLSVTSVIGTGTSLFSNEDITINFQGGPGYRYARVSQSSDYERNVIGNASLNLDWQLSKNTKFEQDFSINAGYDNTVTQADTALTTTVVGNLGLQVSFTVTNNSMIPKDSKKNQHTDYRTNITMLYSF